MKTLSRILLIISVSLIAFEGKADGVKSEKLSLKYALNTFVDAFSHGRIHAFSEMLDNNVKMTSSRGSNIIIYKKAEIIQMLKDVNGVEQNCKTTSSYIENLPGRVIVKVTMTYGSFVRNNYVTMAQTTTGWKVTNISSIFE